MTTLPWRWLGGLVLGVGLAAGCGGGGGDDAAVGTADAMTGGIDAARSCESADDCSDGLSCNGEESCDEGRCVAGTPMRCDDLLDCTVDFCSEELRRCVNRPPDVDGDGYAAADCLDARGMPLGEDCDDAAMGTNPGAMEVCDAMSVDEDCDPTTRGGSDADGDGFEDVRCCNGMGTGACGTDCNDAVRSANPMAPEVCNGIDDDCDGMVDDGVLVMGFLDDDGDGYGDPTMPMMACTAQAGFVLNDDDCDDRTALRSPALPEICDMIDNDCDGTPDPADTTVSTTWYADADGDGFGTRARTTISCAIPTGGWSLHATDCNDGEADIGPAQAERCNGIDDDCNGVADFAFPGGSDLEDDDRDGVADSRCVPTPVPADCDDRDPHSGPGTSELCDGRDNDCDGMVDEMVASYAYFRDADGDGFGGGGGGVIVGCVPVPGYVARGGDCDDSSSMRYPGAAEGCNSTDDDCDSAVDETPASLGCPPPTLGQDRACVAGACRIVGCVDERGDCDGTASNGCETDITADANHCGRCGRPCPMGTTMCVAGECR